MKSIVPVELIVSRIVIFRGEKVLIDRDLGELYEVSTKVLNQAVKRNMRRFPLDFMFQLTKGEKNELVTNCDRFNPLKHSTSFPFAFTAHGPPALRAGASHAALRRCMFPSSRVPRNVGAASVRRFPTHPLQHL